MIQPTTSPQESTFVLAKGPKEENFEGEEDTPKRSLTMHMMGATVTVASLMTTRLGKKVG